MEFGEGFLIRLRVFGNVIHIRIASHFGIVKIMQFFLRGSTGGIGGPGEDEGVPMAAPQDLAHEDGVRDGIGVEG
jgi:hypothetical protein